MRRSIRNSRRGSTPCRAINKSRKLHRELAADCMYIDTAFIPFSKRAASWTGAKLVLYVLHGGTAHSEGFRGGNVTVRYIFRFARRKRDEKRTRERKRGERARTRYTKRNRTLGPWQHSYRISDKFVYCSRIVGSLMHGRPVQIALRERQSGTGSYCVS